MLYNLVSRWVMLLWAGISGGAVALRDLADGTEQSAASLGFSSDKKAPKELWFLGLTNNKTSPREDGSSEIIKLIWVWKHLPVCLWFFSNLPFHME